MKNEIRDIFAGALMRLCRCFPIDQKKIVLKSFRGIECGDNPRAIFDVLATKRPDLRFVWVTANADVAAPGERAGENAAAAPGEKAGENAAAAPLTVQTVRHGSVAEIYHLATAKIWIDNKRKGCWVSKRRGQFYLQTWHGGLALKRIEKDAEDKLPKYYIKSAKRDSKIADAFISGSAWQTKNYRDAFWYGGEIWETGLPRNSIYFQDGARRSAARKIRGAFGLSDGDRVILYAPTFREDYSLEAYDLDGERLLAQCRETLGGTWKLIMRLHPNVADREDYFTYTEDILNGSHYPKMNELLAGCDILITDYSSCMFDAAEGGRPVFLYASDTAAYLKDRGFYFDLGALPFDLAESNDALMEAIAAFDEASYRARTEAFFGQLGLLDNADAAETAAERLLRLLEG